MAEVIDQQQNLGGTLAGFGEWLGVRYRGQSFTLTNNNITAVAFELEQSGTKGLRVSFYAIDTDGLPTGSELYNFTIPNASLAPGLTKYSLPVMLTGLTPGSKYCFILAPWDTVEDIYTDDYRDTVCRYPNPYLGGSCVIAQDGAWSQPDGTALDMKFAVYSDDAGGILAPTVATNPQTGLTYNGATLVGSISNTGGENCTERGFEFNTVEAADKVLYTVGTYGTGEFTIATPELSPATTYYYRAYAKNSAGYGYGLWRSFTTAASQYAITINGLDRTRDVINQSVRIEDVINDQQNTASMVLIDRTGQGIPETDDEIIITLPDGTRVFGGYIVNVQVGDKLQNGVVTASLQCIDYVRLLDRNLVHRSYPQDTDAAIIRDMIDRYCQGSGITHVGVMTFATIKQIQFNYLQLSQCIRKICDLTGYNWYIDYFKDVHYFPNDQNPAPFNIDAACGQYSNLKLTKDASQIKNRVYVRGGTKLSDYTTYSSKGDGVKKQFVLPDKPHNVTVTVNGAAKSLGIKNIDTSGFDWYLNYQEKYIEQDSTATALSTTDTLVVTYQYDIPILVAVENTQSILDHGQNEFAIFDKSIATTEAARDRARAELTDYANNVIEGSFETLTPGFKSGQYVHINLTEYDVDADYIVQSVRAQSMGAGKFSYDITIASAKTMGIIRFLIELLEANKNLIELDPNEVIDELLNQSDALLSDSLLDALTIDSTGPYFTWCTDSLDAGPNTRMRWDLFQWG